MFGGREVVGSPSKGGESNLYRQHHQQGGQTRSICNLADLLLKSVFFLTFLVENEYQLFKILRLLRWGMMIPKKRKVRTLYIGKAFIFHIRYLAAGNGIDQASWS